MRESSTTTCEARNCRAHGEAIGRRGSLTIRFRPKISWDAVPTGRHGRQRTCGDPAIPARLTMQVLFGMVEIVAPLLRATISTRQTTGDAEIRLRLVGLGWTRTDFSTLSCRQKSLALHIPYRGSRGLHLC